MLKAEASSHVLVSYTKKRMFALLASETALAADQLLVK